jgi:DNA-binding MarR family transcriptional regulator
VRRPSDEDARVTLVDLTTSGRELGERLGTLVSARMDELLAGVSTADQDQLTRVAGLVLTRAHP